MKDNPILRTCCIFSHPLAPFVVSKFYSFTKLGEYTSFSVYNPVGFAREFFATRLLDKSRVLMIEDTEDVVAVFIVC